MALKKDLKPQGFAAAPDPAVAAVMTDSLADVRARAMDPAKRKKAAADAKRHKSTFDLSPEIQDRVYAIADELGVPVSHVAEHLLDYALNAVGQGALDLRQRRVRSTRSLKFEYFLRPISEANRPFVQEVENNDGDKASVRPA